jgi:hypothetical protein
MSSSTLFKIAGGIFAILPLGHTIFYRDIIVPNLNPSGASEGAYASKVSWNQANGYFITTGIAPPCFSPSITAPRVLQRRRGSETNTNIPTALLCFKWANEGVAPGIERYIFGVLMATHLLTSLAYLRKGISRPPAIYISLSLLMGTAVLQGA